VIFWGSQTNQERPYFHQSMANPSSDSESQLSISADGFHNLGGSSHHGSSSGAGTGSHGHQQHNSGGADKLSVGIFLLATSTYFVTCFVESCTLTMLPVWLATNRIHGKLTTARIRRIIVPVELMLYFCTYLFRRIRI
jgi:hypothetical protein